MRCSCQVCDTYMAQSEGLELGCVCPNCGYRCKACLGTDTVVSRESLSKLRDDPMLMADLMKCLDNGTDEDDDDPGRRADFGPDEDRRQWDD